MHFWRFASDPNIERIFEVDYLIKKDNIHKCVLEDLNFNLWLYKLNSVNNICRVFFGHYSELRKGCPVRKIKTKKNTISKKCLSPSTVSCCLNKISFGIQKMFTKIELPKHFLVQSGLLEKSSKIHVDSLKTLVANEMSEIGENVSNRQPIE